ncbi:MAG: hypothetical protein WB696_30680 [Chthoniobacterales bacterium]
MPVCGSSETEVKQVIPIATLFAAIVETNRGFGQLAFRSKKLDDVGLIADPDFARARAKKAARFSISSWSSLAGE